MVWLAGWAIMAMVSIIFTHVHKHADHLKPPSSNPASTTVMVYVSGNIMVAIKINNNNSSFEWSEGYTPLFGLPRFCLMMWSSFTNLCEIFN
jgi:hypothetical protein